MVRQARAPRTRRLGFLLVTFLSLTSAATPAWAAPAPLRVSSISPAVADRGELVTITGRGFGAHNLEVTVGGVPVELVSATGSRASFRVPALAAAGDVTVEARNPGGHVGRIGLRVRVDGAATVVLDGAGRVSATIGRDGGRLAAGSVSLTIPAGALSEDTSIAMTPILDLADSPVSGSLIGGVKLEPEGLRFLKPAVLRMPLPAGIAPASVLGFGSRGDGTDLHLQPREIAGGTITMSLWHFSTGGASSGGASAAAAVQSRTPSTAERQALQRIAAAQPACEAELLQAVLDGPGCVNLHQESVRALFDWYTNAVRSGLEQADTALSFEAEDSLVEWLAWAAEVARVFLNDAPPQCGTLQIECDHALALATAAVGAHAQRRLDNCTGTSLASQIRDVARMADFAAVGAIDLTSVGLPDAASGALLRACAHLEIAVTDFPAVAALNVANTLRGRVTLDVHSGPDRTDVPFTLTADGALVSAAADGSFQTTLTPTNQALNLNVTLEAEAADPSLQNTSFSDVETLIRPTRARLQLLAQGPTTVAAGGTIQLLVRVAGDGMAGMAITFGGPLSSVSPSPATTNSQGEATAVATILSNPTNTNDFLTAVLFDGTSASVAITIGITISVSLSPTTATLSPGGTLNLTASVTNSFLGVTWSATGGAIVSTGSNTARYDAGTTPGTYSVTATSSADPTASASATITITAPATVGVVHEQTAASIGANAFGPNCEPGRTAPHGETFWSDAMSCSHEGATASSQTAFTETYSGGRLISLVAATSAHASADGSAESSNAAAVGRYRVRFRPVTATRISITGALALSNPTGKADIVLVGGSLVVQRKEPFSLVLSAGVTYELQFEAQAVADNGANYGTSSQASYDLHVSFSAP